MLESLSYSVSGALPDRTRYSMSYSASKWTPDPQDLRLDDAISSFAKLGFLPSSSFNDVHQAQHFSDYDHEPPHQPRYAGSYAGDIEPEYEYADSTSRREALYRNPPRAIEYPSSRDRESRASSHYQHSQYHRKPPTESTYYQATPPRYDHQRALVPYNHAQQHDDLEPSDSISQISASTRKHRYTYVPREERRGRTRRREDGYGAPTVFSGTTVRNGGGGGGGSGRSRVETGTGGMGFQTRVISPFD